MKIDTIRLMTSLILCLPMIAFAQNGRLCIAPLPQFAGHQKPPPELVLNDANSGLFVKLDKKRRIRYQEIKCHGLIIQTPIMNIVLLYIEIKSRQKALSSICLNFHSGIKTERTYACLWVTFILHGNYEKWKIPANGVHAGLLIRDSRKLYTMVSKMNKFFLASINLVSIFCLQRIPLSTIKIGSCIQKLSK